jgi:DNA-nicking Smr family endonuclease
VEDLSVTRHRPTEEDVRLFREAVGPVRELDHGRHHHDAPAPPPPVPVQRQLDEQRVLEDLLSDGLDPADLETGEELVYLRPGLPYALLRRLRRGQFSVGDQLDLHGLTVDEARVAVAAFLHDVRRRGQRCVRVIHGKGNRSRLGQPVLKVKVSHWLRQRDEVLAFCSARAVDGGTGAVYVLLKA